MKPKIILLSLSFIFGTNLASASSRQFECRDIHKETQYRISGDKKKGWILRERAKDSKSFVILSHQSQSQKVNKTQIIEWSDLSNYGFYLKGKKSFFRYGSSVEDFDFHSCREIRNGRVEDTRSYKVSVTLEGRALSGTSVSVLESHSKGTREHKSETNWAGIGFVQYKPGKDFKQDTLVCVAVMNQLQCIDLKAREDRVICHEMKGERCQVEKTACQSRLVAVHLPTNEKFVGIQHDLICATRIQ